MHHQVKQVPSSGVRNSLVTLSPNKIVCGILKFYLLVVPKLCISDIISRVKFYARKGR